MLAMILTGKIAKRMVYENLIQVKVAKAGFQKSKSRSLADLWCIWAKRGFLGNKIPKEG